MRRRHGVLGILVSAAVAGLGCRQPFLCNEDADCIGGNRCDEPTQVCVRPYELFEIDSLTSPVSIQRGTTGSANLHLRRPDRMRLNIALTFADLPSGVTVSAPVIQPSSEHVSVTFAASATAAIGLADATLSATAGETKRTYPFQLIITEATAGPGPAASVWEALIWDQDNWN